MIRPTPVILSAETLELAAAELQQLGTVYAAADRDGLGLLIFRTHAGVIVAAGGSEDVPRGQICEVVLEGRHRAPVATDRRAAS